jgi:CubicO group peptidase (beta-lactamase class C family)
MLLQKGELNGVRLLSPKTVELMTDDHMSPEHRPVNSLFRGFGFGLGVWVMRRHGEDWQYGSPGMFGWGSAACCQVWIDPAEEMVSLVMMQHLPAPGKWIWPLPDLFKQTAYQAIVD